VEAERDALGEWDPGDVAEPKSCASSTTNSVDSAPRSCTNVTGQPSSSAVASGLETNTGSPAARPAPWSNNVRALVMFGRAVPDFEPAPAAQDRSLQSFFRLIDAVRAVAPDSDAAERAYHYWATIHGYVMLEPASMGAPTADEAERLDERALALLAV
jgi:hypothetical protein